VVIPEGAVPDFKSRAELRDWLIGKFSEVGNITIASTGQKLSSIIQRLKELLKMQETEQITLLIQKLKKLYQMQNIQASRAQTKGISMLKGRMFITQV